MTVTIFSWMIPCALTIAIWAALVLWPVRSSGGDYNFGQAFEALFRLVAGVVSTLTVWLVYFALMLWTS
jgi:hypothetical protein